MSRVQEIGAYAGFAAVIGLAVLSALYFSQARDLRRLREWAGRAPERAAEMTGQPASPVPGRVVAVPQRQGQATQAPAQPATSNGDAAPSVAAGAAEAVKVGEGAKPGEAEAAGAKDEAKPDGEGA